MVEKPFTVTAGEADEHIALARKKRKMLSVFHNRRWDGFDPVMKPGNWREISAPGTGVFYDLGIHFIDQALCLFGIPNSIEADVQIQRENGLAADYFDVILRYNDHLKVILKSSRFVREPGPRYKLHGSKGSFIKYGSDPQEPALIAGGTPDSVRDWGKEAKVFWGKLNASIGGLHIEGRMETLPGNYADFYRNVYEHIAGNEELEVKQEEARTAVWLMELALKSHKKGRSIPVTH